MNRVLKFKLCAIILAIFIAGCTEKKEEKKYEFNPIVQDAEFRQTFLQKPIKFVAPASGTDLKKVDKLRETLLVEIPNDWFKEGLIYHSNTDEKRFQFLKEAPAVIPESS